MFRTSALALVLAAGLASAPAVADWTHEFTEDDQYAPAWFTAGTTTTGQFVTGGAVNFSTRAGANDLPQVGVLGTTSGMMQQISTAIAIVPEREDDYSAFTIVNIESVAQSARQGLVVRVNDELLGYAAVIDYSTAELVIARIDLPNGTYSPIVTQPLLNFNATTAYALIAVVDGSSLTVEAYDFGSGDDEGEFEDVALAAATFTNSVEVATGYAGLYVSSNEGVTPVEGTFYGAALETTERECDFNGDNEDDLFWVNSQDGSVWVWTMDDDDILGAQYIGAVPANQGWELISTADFNDDDQADLLWYNSTTGECGSWESNEGAYAYRPLPGLSAANWEMEGCGEMTEDGQPDIIWRNKQTNALWIWEMDRFEIDDAREFFAAPAGWKVEAIADMNRDGDDDLVFRNDNGANGIITMDDTNTLTWEPLPFVGGNWTIVGLTDINDDDDTDLLWRNDDTGECATWEMNGTDFGSFAGFPSPGDDWEPAN